MKDLFTLYRTNFETVMSYMILKRIFIVMAALLALGSRIDTVLAQPVITKVAKPTTPEDDSKPNSDTVPDVIPILAELEQVLILRFKYKTDLLQGLEQAVAEKGIRNGVILSGIGSVRNYHIHSVSNSVFPSENIYIKDTDAPSDLVSMDGYIIDGRIHVHVALSNEAGAFGGHLEYGTSVFTFAIITVGVFKDGIDLTRVDDKTYR